MLTPQQLQAAGAKMSTAANAGGLPPPSYSSNPGGMTGATLDSYVLGTPAASSATVTPNSQNLVQKTAGSFIKPIETAGIRTGQAVGEGGIEAANALSGGALDKYAKGGSVNNALGAYNATPTTAPVTGDTIRPVNEDNAETAAGDAIGTVALGAENPATAGAALALGGSMSDKKGAGESAINTVIGALSGKILEGGFNMAAPLIEKAALKYGTPVIDGISHLVPESAKAGFKGLADHVAQVVPDISEARVLPGSVSNAIKGADTAISKTVEAPFNAVGKLTKGVVGKAGEGAADVLNSVQKAVSKGNVADNLESSVQRLNQVHTDGLATNAEPEASGKSTNNPLDAYDKYFAQEQKFKGDAKEDTALGMVGSQVGDAYNKVASMRRAAGANMGTEMDKIGHLPVDVSGAEKPFEDELAKNGVSIDPESGEITAGKTSKLSTQDVKMLQNYSAELQKLGPTPTAKELDAFLSRVPNELDVYKNQNNIVKATNGERMIKGHLSALADELKPGAHPETGETTKGEFGDFAKSKADYAALSNFLKEGQGFLGKKTMSGDYAKDASLAKSSIQSALNGGKKDFLMRLEKLTGFPAVDHSMLALQAMKDAGNFRGESLLDLLSPQSKGKIPLTKEGVIGHVIDAGVNKGKQILVGDANTQTRRIIQEQMTKTN